MRAFVFPAGRTVGTRATLTFQAPVLHVRAMALRSIVKGESFMKRLATLVVVVLTAAAAACDDVPTQPSDTVTFTVQLSPANEVPPVVNVEAGGNGIATARLSVTRDTAGAITTATASFDVVLTGFPAATALTMAHIHMGTAGNNGPIVVDTGLVANQVILANGAGGFTRAGVTVDVAAARNIINTPSSFYFNVHSMLNPGGMARGRLVRQ
jgi:hypothetical protein